MNAKKLALVTSRRYAVTSASIIFLILSAYLVFTNIRFIQLSFEQSVREDQKMIAQSIRIGDIAILEKFSSSKVKSGSVLVYQVSGSKKNEPVLTVGNKNLLSQTGFISVGSLGILLRLDSHFFDEWQKRWTIHAISSFPVSIFLEALLLSVFISIFVYFALIKLLSLMATKFSAPLIAAASDLQKYSVNEDEALTTPSFDQTQSIDEVEALVSTTKQLTQRIITHSKEFKKLEVLEALQKQSQQVAHDIQSPVGALKAANSAFATAPERAKKIMERSIDRIESIVEDLNKPTKSSGLLEGLKSFDLEEVLSQTVEEKEAEHSSLTCVLSYGCSQPLPKLVGDKNTILRVLSNMINNSVEASNSIPKVMITIKEDPVFIHVILADNGKGISPEDLKFVTKYGFTKGKDRGSGKGLAHANEVMEEIGGALSIASKVDQGTYIRLSFSRLQTVFIKKFVT